MAETLHVDVTLADDNWSAAVSDIEEVCLTAARAAYEAGREAEKFEAEAGILLTDDMQVRELNKTYRDKDKPTNVLSFAAQEGGAAFDHAKGMLGDIVIAYGVANREALQENKSLENHLSHLVVHGMLHLLGHDHKEALEAEQMENLEIQTLAGLGVANPYNRAPEAGSP